MTSQAGVMFVANQRGCLIGGLGLARARFVESKVSIRTSIRTVPISILQLTAPTVGIGVRAGGARGAAAPPKFG